MKHKTLYLLSFFSAVSAGALLLFQLYWIVGVRNHQLEEFKQTANNILDKIVSDLENYETVSQVIMPTPFASEASSIQTTSTIQSKHKEKKIFPIDLNNRDELQNQIPGRNETEYRELIRILANLEEQKKQREKKQKLENITVNESMNIKKVLIENIFERIISIEVPIVDRITYDNIDTLISAELKSRSIDLAYCFQVKGEDGTVLFESSVAEDYSADSYRRQLFPSDLLADKYYLTLKFPHVKFHHLRALGWAIFISLSLLSVIVIVFSITLTTVYKQRKLAKIKSNFVSNITHELKTPIANISLASEMLLDKNIPSDVQRVSHLSSIIADQAKRLTFLVERVLHIALFEKGKLRMQYQEENLHQVIQMTLKSFSIQIEQKGAEVETYFNASPCTVIVDEVHFSNIISNLIDNALKYSGTKPCIQLCTKVEKKKIILAVKDNGIGIKEEDIGQIFEQFYRVGTDNRHDIKGFGLGLSYVKSVIKEMGGEIWVESEFGKGSSFMISLPV